MDLREEAEQIVRRNEDDLVGVVYHLLLENEEIKQMILNLEFKLEYLEIKHSDTEC